MAAYLETGTKRSADQHSPLDQEPPIKRQCTPDAAAQFIESDAIRKATHPNDDTEPGQRHDNSERSKKDDNTWQVIDRTSRRRKKNIGNLPAISHSSQARLQSALKLPELQSLVLYLLADGHAPQWISVQHRTSFDKVVVLMVPGLEANLFNGIIPLQTPTNDIYNSPNHKDTSDLDANERAHLLKVSPDHYYPTELQPDKLPTCLSPLASIFKHIWPFRTPGDFNRMHSPVYALLSVPTAQSKSASGKKGPRPPVLSQHWRNDPMPVTAFLATKAEMADNGFALHPIHLNTDAEIANEQARRYKTFQSANDGWVNLPDPDIIKDTTPDGNDLLIIDCEMVTTTADRFALARVSIINHSGETVLDEFVKPPDLVTDCLTQFSGITMEMLDKATLTLLDIQQRLKDLFTPNTILAGHSLDSDLRALKMSFPHIVDTTLLFPHPKGPPQKSSLKWLCQKYLDKQIQNRGAQGHDSIEDAQSCLALITQKCEKGKAWGTAEATTEPLYTRLARTNKEDRQGDSGHGSSADGAARGKTSAHIDHGDATRGFGAAAKVAISCQDDDDVVKAIDRVINGQTPNDSADHDGCDFVWARLRDLGETRAWSNANKANVTSPVDNEKTAVTRDESIEHNTVNTNSLDGHELSKSVTQTISRITRIWESLPDRTAFIVYSGSGDPRDMVRLQRLHSEFKLAYQTTKWDELKVRWTDVDEQALKDAVDRARNGVGFIAVRSRS